MADNFSTEQVVTPGATFASDEIVGGPTGGTAHYSIGKLAYGALNAATLVEDTDVGRLPTKAVLSPSATGGLDNYHAVSAATTNAANVKGSAGNLYSIGVFNVADYPIYVKLHNTNIAPTAGVGVVYTIGVQAGTRCDRLFPVGLSFSTGIGITIVKGMADNDATAVALNDAVVDLSYK